MIVFRIKITYTDVLDLNVDAFGNDAAVNKFIHLNTDSGFGDIKDNSSASMIELVRHAFVDCTIGFDIHKITNLVCDEILRQLHMTVRAKRTREHITSPTTVTEGMRHFLSSSKTMTKRKVKKKNER